MLGALGLAVGAPVAETPPQADENLICPMNMIQAPEFQHVKGTGLVGSHDNYNVISDCADTTDCITKCAEQCYGNPDCNSFEFVPGPHKYTASSEPAFNICNLHDEHEGSGNWDGEQPDGTIAPFILCTPKCPIGWEQFPWKSDVPGCSSAGVGNCDNLHTAANIEACAQECSDLDICKSFEYIPEPIEVKGKEYTGACLQNMEEGPSSRWETDKGIIYCGQTSFAMAQAPTTPSEDFKLAASAPAAATAGAKKRAQGAMQA